MGAVDRNSRKAISYQSINFLKSILSIILAISFIDSAHGQQTNLHVSMPPLIGPDMTNGKQISASYIRMHGDRIDLNGIDINTISRWPISNTTTSSLTLGAALLGGDLDSEMDSDTHERDLSGIVLHGSYNREYLMAEKPSSSLAFFMGVPFSCGDFTIENDENDEDVTMYNFMAGVQGGTRLGLEMGDFQSSPWLMVNLMGGYVEHYDGGVYYENLNSGDIPIFAVLSSGLDIHYIPLKLTLGGMYQRTFESGDNKPINTAIIQLGFSF